MGSKLNLLNILITADNDMKKITADKTTLIIVLLMYRYHYEKKKIFSADKFLDENIIISSRSKKISIIQGLEKNKIIERTLNPKDKRSKVISIKKEIIDKLDKYLEK
tara:strand:- start:127 stop:447 length:321 start_codon:yes stop_codon:yes gene_type:complete